MVLNSSESSLIIASDMDQLQPENLDAIEKKNVSHSLSETCEMMNLSPASVKRYNFMVVGPSGSGKTTFCTRLLKRYFPDIQLECKEGNTEHIQELGRCEEVHGNQRVIITIVDAPGTLDSINYRDRFDPVIKYIEQQNQLYERNELYRQPLQQENDSRIHCCFYFIMPHRVTTVDCESMRRLHSMAALVPIVAKADTMQIPELTSHLLRIHKCINQYSIQVFDFGERNINTAWISNHHIGNTQLQCSSSKLANEKEKKEQDESKSASALVRPQLPNVFAIISGERHYMWGVASEKDPRHSDTQRLHKLLFRSGGMGRLHLHAENLHVMWKREEDAKQQKREFMFPCLQPLNFIARFFFVKK